MKRACVNAACVTLTYCGAGVGNASCARVDVAS